MLHTGHNIRYNQLNHPTQSFFLSFKTGYLWFTSVFTSVFDIVCIVIVLLLLVFVFCIFTAAKQIAPLGTK